VSAKDRATGKSQAITISASSGLAKQEVERLVRDAEAHAQDDQQRREQIEARNRVDTLVYSAEKTLAENRDKLEAADIEATEKAIAEAKQASEAGEKPRLEAAAEALTKATHRMAEVLYQRASADGSGSAAAGSAAAGSAPGSDGTGNGDVVDAEVVDDKK